MIDPSPAAALLQSRREVGGKEQGRADREGARSGVGGAHEAAFGGGGVSLRAAAICRQGGEGWWMSGRLIESGGLKVCGGLGVGVFSGSSCCRQEAQGWAGWAVPFRGSAAPPSEAWS